MKRKEQEFFLEAFGKHLAETRRLKGFSQEQLAYDADLDLSTLSRIERGILNISIANVYKIAAALNIHYKELFDFDVKV